MISAISGQARRPVRTRNHPLQHRRGVEVLLWLPRVLLVWAAAVGLLPAAEGISGNTKTGTA